MQASFTPSQWQELHSQAIIFNCISFGFPIPSHLLVSLSKTTYPPLLDSDPRRCRRTDGKKWRCSRAACPDSKYCERHLHRGKNRLAKFSKAPCFKHPRCSGSDLRLERSAESEEKKTISLHCFFEEKPERREEPQAVPLPALLDLNV